MIKFLLNNESITWKGDLNKTLLYFLREVHQLTAAKDGCSGEGTCGACLVEVDQKPKLACKVKLSQLRHAKVYTLEGIDKNTKQTIAQSFTDAGAVQCGFCTPGLIMRTNILLHEHPNPTREQIKKAIQTNLCRCTGYQKIIEAIQMAAQRLASPINEPNKVFGKIGEPLNKYKALEAALGIQMFTDDIYLENMCFGALKFSDFPRAKVKHIDITEAAITPGVLKVFTAKDIPGKPNIGLIYNDWPLMISQGQFTHYIGDVLASVVAIDEASARAAVDKITVEYQDEVPVTCPHKAMKEEAPSVHPGKENLLEVCRVARGDTSKALNEAGYKASGVFQTQRIEHAFMEKESATALPHNDGIHLYSQSQGVYEDRRQVARLLGIAEDKVRVTLLPNGGGFGGKEDLSVQGHVALMAYGVNRPVKLTLTRQESIKMHPKRHPIWMDMTIGCNKSGQLTVAILNAVGDTGAYASVGTKVLERVAGHATGGYSFPSIKLEAKTVYTNNIPCGAMRGFGANQVTFALEVLIDDLCQQGGFDRWKFRYNNALTDGGLTSTGQKVYGVGIRDCLLALKNDFYSNKYAGLACGIKNSGVGNGMVDESGVRVTIVSDKHVRIEHGWTEMGQGVHNMALQTLCTETGLAPEIIEVCVDTEAQIKTGMTTSSRATALLGLAIIDASKELKVDMETKQLHELIGKQYYGHYACNWTTKPGDTSKEQKTHYSYGYAAQLCLLDDEGQIKQVIAAHDGGKIMNPKLFEGQIQGAVHMGLGFAISESLPMKDARLVSDKLRDCNILRAKDTPEITVKMVEKPDPIGPYGAKGVGEIGLVPTAGAVANAYSQYTGKKYYQLPLKIEH